MEEGNIIEHRDYLKLEEEKRARARVVRAAVEGPVLRWISRKEQVKVQVTPPTPSPAQYPSQYGFVYNPNQGPSHSGLQTYHSPFRAYVPAPPSTTQAPEVSSPAPQGSASASQPQSSTPSSEPSYYYYPVQPLPQPPPAPQERIDDVCKNYVVHELSQDASAVKPPWKDTMSAIFGDEVKWDEVRVFTGKQRPMSMFPFSFGLLTPPDSRSRSTCANLSNHWDTCQVSRPTNEGAFCERCGIQDSN
jgi:hypothetical protein